MLIQICVGSSCHLKGSQQLIALFQEAIVANHLENIVTLSGNFCAGRCNREGITVTINDTVYTGVTPDLFKEFFETAVLQPLAAESGGQVAWNA